MLTDRPTHERKRSADSRAGFMHLPEIVAEIYNRELLDLLEAHRKRRADIESAYDQMAQSYTPDSKMHQRCADLCANDLRAEDNAYAARSKELVARRDAATHGATDLKAMIHRKDGTLELDPVLRLIPAAQRKEHADGVVYELRDAGGTRTPVQCTDDATIVADYRPETLVAALALEAARFGEPVQVSGSEEFIAKIEDIARSMKVRVERAPQPQQAASQDTTVQDDTAVEDVEDTPIQRPVRDKPKESFTANSSSDEVRQVCSGLGISQAVVPPASTITDAMRAVAFRVVGVAMDGVRDAGGATKPCLILRANPSVPALLLLPCDEQTADSVREANAPLFMRIEADGDRVVGQAIEDDEAESALARWETAQQAINDASRSEDTGRDDGARGR